ncbi:hypothetical protein MSAN_00122700 [Mycena sanguinolenta]|uniref:Uncharacterized protein n=1 Tax=Mycena sanguinolenta TaxID=230812 RepID=A0A8H6ZIQ3_9AGAR|nr:hypothetical protein MSAN_00122700 [Mycena sanguinolenta]
MDDHSHPEPEFTHSSTYDPESPSHGSGMFSQSQQFTVMGGTFSNITNNNYTTHSLPSDFRMIPMGDIDLRYPIRVDERTGVAYSRPPERACARRLYSAKVDGRNSTLTVAVYQGNGAEEEWRREIAKYMSLRHPNIIQMCGAASSGAIHALLFNDEIVKASHDELWLAYAEPELPGLSGTHALLAGAEIITTFIDSLTLEKYHRTCDLHLGQHRCLTISAATTINLGAVFHCPGGPLEDSVEIAFLPSAEASRLGEWTTLKGGTGEVMPDGWNRSQSGDVINRSFYLTLDISSNLSTWLSQANHIFRRLNIMCDFQDYVCVCYIEFELKICGTTEDPPPGFLFLCPKEDFQTGPSSFCWPACAAYWSLDPSGADRLSLADATRLGFPPLKFVTEGHGYSWDGSVYEGLLQFHRAKGFNPYSRYIALHLGEPLYQVYSQADASFAYDGEDFGADIDSDCNSAYMDDYESGYAPTSACDDSDLAVDAEVMHHEEDVHDLGGEHCGSEHAEITNYANYNASGLTFEEEIVVRPSQSLKVLMSIQLALILFLGLSWVYDYLVHLFRNFIRLPVAQ